MLKVLHLITGLATGGSEIMLLKLLKYNDDSLVENIVVSLSSKGSVGSEIEKCGVRVITLNINPRRPNPMALRHLQKIINETHPNILHTWLYQSDFMGLVLKLIHRRSQKFKLLWNLRCTELDSKDRHKYLKWLLPLLSRFSHLPDAVVVNSLAGKKIHQHMRYKPRHWELIPNGFDVEEFKPNNENRASVRQELRLDIQTPLIGLVARFHPMKDHCTFLDAAQLTRQVSPSTHFVCVGKNIDWNNNFLVAEINKRNLKDCVYLLGERSDIPRITSAFDIASCTSYSGGFPNVLGEAMACGVPCVSTDVGDASTILNGVGTVVPCRNPQALSQAWLRLLSTKLDERQRYGFVGRGKVMDSFPIGKITKQYCDLYYQLTESKQTKVCFIITGLNVGGAEIMLLKLLERIDRTQFSPHVISLTDIGVIGPRVAALGIPIEALGMRCGILDLIRFVRLLCRLRQIRPDVVHTWMCHADLVGGFAAWIARVPAVIWGVFSSDFLRIDHRFSIRFVLILCEKVSSWLPNCVQYCSEYGKEVHGEYGYREKLSVVIPIGIDVEKFRPGSHFRREVRRELGIIESAPLIGLIGRFDPLKNHEGFIKAAGFLHRKMPEVHFLMVGTGVEWSNPVLKNWIEGAKLVDVFHLLGRRDDIPRITASLDLASLTSWSEAFPNVLVEAMACGVPCVSTNVGDAAFILGDAGWIAPIGDMESLAAQWMTFLTLPESKRRFWGERARIRTVDQFELGAVVKRYEAMYVDVINQKHLIREGMVGQA